MRQCRATAAAAGWLCCAAAARQQQHALSQGTLCLSEYAEPGGWCWCRPSWACERGSLTISLCWTKQLWGWWGLLLPGSMPMGTPVSPCLYPTVMHEAELLPAMQPAVYRPCRCCLVNYEDPGGCASWSIQAQCACLGLLRTKFLFFSPAVCTHVCADAMMLEGAV